MAAVPGFDYVFVGLEDYYGDPADSTDFGVYGLYFSLLSYTKELVLS